MNKALATCFLLFVCATMGSCARDAAYVKSGRPPDYGTVVLPEKEKGGLPAPYEVNGERYYPLPDADGFVEHGTASWYGGKFHGRPTASGEIYDMHGKTAAHRILPLQTYAMVTNLSNNRETVVRINDRGPFVKGRVIDLSYAAGKEIGLIGPGTAPVKIVALGKEVGRRRTGGGPGRPVLERRALRKGPFTIQVGAFRDRRNARMLADRLRVIFDHVSVSVFIDRNARTFYRVQTTRSETLSEAKALKEKLEGMGFSGAFVVSLQD